ncbi:MAG: E2/UBC family protein [Bacteroidales bacterium]
MRRQFDLPEEDSLYLNSQEYSWETLNENNMQWLIIYDFPVPNGYNCEKVAVAIKIETGYPRTPLDMAYFYPAVIRKDMLPINATCPQNIDGKQFQRWSRHRTPQNPWRVGIDDISTHLLMVSYWFKQEFLKR